MPFTKKAKTIETDKLEVVASTVETAESGKIKGMKESSETVTIACRLAHGLIFDDVPSKFGGTKVIEFPGINDHLRGLPEGVLVDAGSAVAVTMLRSDWEALKRVHGRETVFTGYRGNPPCLYEYGSVDAFKKDVDGVIKTMTHGLEAKDPKLVGVEEIKKE